MSIWLNSDDRMHLATATEAREGCTRHIRYRAYETERCVPLRPAPPKKEDQMVQGLQVTWFSKLLDRKPTQRIVQRKRKNTFKVRLGIFHQSIERNHDPAGVTVFVRVRRRNMILLAPIWRLIVTWCGGTRNSRRMRTIKSK